MKSNIFGNVNKEVSKAEVCGDFTRTKYNLSPIRIEEIFSYCGIENEAVKKSILEDLSNYSKEKILPDSVKFLHKSIFYNDDHARLEQHDCTDEKSNKLDAVVFLTFLCVASKETDPEEIGYQQLLSEAANRLARDYPSVYKDKEIPKYEQRIVYAYKVASSKYFEMRADLW